MEADGEEEEEDKNAKVTLKQLKMKCQKNLCMDVVLKYTLKIFKGPNEAKCLKGNQCLANQVKLSFSFMQEYI